MSKSNRSLIEKAEMTVSDLTTNGGYLEVAQAQRFLRLVIEQAKVIPMSTVVPMKAPKQQIDKIKFGSRVLRAGEEATALPSGDRMAPDTSKVELDAQLFKGEVPLNYEVLEDNIERGSLERTVMSLLAERIAADMDEVAVQGDTSSTDDFLAKFDGMIEQATSNTVDGASANMSKTIAKKMSKTLPKRYRRNKSRLRFMVSPDAEFDYRYALSERATMGGDDFTVKNIPVAFSGIPFEPVDQFPEDLGGSTDETVAFLMDPKNLHTGIWRQIRIETDRDIRAGVLLIVLTLRFDVKYAEEEGVVKGYSIKVSD